ncbi:hypothetical protein [Ideonella paludis]|uniref:Uncharacterized protein n=1 Tax=Ideonella paludis TaxID=1233411 RepID=A0ABS5DTA4_9BURK|nr:hypothetical protein [Ideonella paludis]MBQ0934385.1 hypothetical protein [Ideonella paludis]
MGRLISKACGTFSALVLALLGTSVLAHELPQSGKPQDLRVGASPSSLRPKATIASNGSDVTAPVLLRVRLPLEASAQGPLPNIPVRFSVQDEGSGLAWIRFDFTAPNGSNIPTEQDLHGRRSWQGLTAAALSPMAAPGTYTLRLVWIMDLAGNSSVIEGAALDALGVKPVTVTSAPSFDDTAPLFVSGRLLQSKVSKSATVPGTSRPQFLRAEVFATDSGTGLTAGIASSTLFFCKLDQSECVYLNGSVGQRGLSEGSLLLSDNGNSLARASTGDYHLQLVYVRDHAGNITGLVSTRFFGSYDFSTSFPGSVLTITP